MFEARFCLFCKEPFFARRSDHFFDSGHCARRWRGQGLGTLPPDVAVERVIPRRDRMLFARAIRSAKPPPTAIGYKLYSREIELWMPLVGTKRRDGSRPRHDFYKLYPEVELPRVPLQTEYQVGWVFRGGVFRPSDPAYLVMINFPEDMRRTHDIGRRLRAWALLQAEQMPQASLPGPSEGQAVGEVEADEEDVEDSATDEDED